MRIGPPYGDCVDSNPLFSAAGSGNGHHVTYRQVVCQQMCTQKHVTEACGCVDETLPMLAGVDLTDTIGVLRTDPESPIRQPIS